MSTVKRITNITLVDETDKSVEVRAIFDYGPLGSRRITIRIPHKEPDAIVKELKKAYMAKKPVDPGSETTLPKSIDMEE